MGRLKLKKMTYGCKSGKRRYVDYSTAYQDMVRIQNRQREQGEEDVVKDIYQCRSCRGYHLSRGLKEVIV